MNAAADLTLESARRQVMFSSTSTRGLAILAVLAIHISSEALPALQLDHPLLWFGVRVATSTWTFAVPSFLILTFFSLSLRPIKDGRLWSYYRMKLPKVIVPYLAYTTLYGGLSALDGRRWLSWPLTIQDVMFGRTSYHLWFIRNLIILYIAHPFAWRLYRRYLATWPVSIALLGVLQVWVCWQAGEESNRFAPYHWMPWTLLGNWWYLFAGYVAADHTDRIVGFARGSLGRWLLVGIALATLSGGFEPVFGAAVLLLIVSWGPVTGRVGALITSFGFYSFGVYLVHPALRFVIDRHLSAASQPLLYLFVCFTVLPAVSLQVVRLLARSPVARLLA